jgi:hypothetical protein
MNTEMEKTHTGPGGQKIKLYEKWMYKAPWVHIGTKGFQILPLRSDHIEFVSNWSLELELDMRY